MKNILSLTLAALAISVSAHASSMQPLSQSDSRALALSISTSAIVSQELQDGTITPSSYASWNGKVNVRSVSYQHAVSMNGENVAQGTPGSVTCTMTFDVSATLMKIVHVYQDFCPWDDYGI